MIKKLIFIIFMITVFSTICFSHTPERILTPGGKQVTFIAPALNDEEFAENIIEYYNNYSKDLPGLIKGHLTDGLIMLHIVMDDNNIILTNARLESGKIIDYDVLVKLDKNNELLIEDQPTLIFNTYEIRYQSELKISKAAVEKLSKSENKKKEFLSEWNKNIVYKGFGLNGIKSFFINVVITVYSIF